VNQQRTQQVLASIQRVINLDFVLEDPPVDHHIGPRRPWYQVPRVVGQLGLILIHSSTSVGINERATDRDLDRRQCRETRGSKLQAVHRFCDPSNITGDHRVGVASITSHRDRVVD
jgi:hypothetical protein